MDKWLITGGCGFLGTSLIRSLLGENKECSIRVIDNLSTGKREDLALVTHFEEIPHSKVFGGPKGVELIVGDILDEPLSTRVTEGVDIIVHFAANTGVGPSVINPRIDMLANVVGTFNYLEAARINNVSRFIFASSGAPAGEVEPPIHEELPAHPVSPYGASKLAGEGYCSAYYKTFGIDTICLRFGNVYGPGSVHKDSVVARFIRRALQGKALEIYGDGSQTRDFIYIDDLINAVKLASVMPNNGGEVFQIASSRETTISEITAMITKILNSHGFLIEVSHSGIRKGDVMRNFSDTSKASAKLSWNPKFNLEQGLKQTITYFLKN